MREHQAEYASLGVEAIPGGLAGAYRESQEAGGPAGDPRYRQPQNVLRVEGLVAIALRWMSGTPGSR